jgi:hypothetical protein
MAIAAELLEPVVQVPPPGPTTAAQTLHAFGALQRALNDDPEDERFRRYWSPAFTQALVEHVRVAKEIALAGRGG